MAIDQAVFSLDSISKMSSLEHLMGSFDFSIGESDKSAGQGTVSKLAFEALRIRTVTSRVRIQVSQQARTGEEIGIEKANAGDLSELLPEDQRPEAVAKRIIDFIEAASGGRPDLLMMLIDAAEQGFAEAEAIFGGKLPDVSYRTMDLVRQGLEELANPRSAGGEQFGPAARVEIQVETKETFVEVVNFNYSANALPSGGA